MFFKGQREAVIGFVWTVFLTARRWYPRRVAKQWRREWIRQDLTRFDSEADHRRF